ncbi:MAG: hypothetical protein Q8916_02725 [Bacteroidota bacterium]|nr:hypothetical protein [Bacteroidota bacterium]MDP4229302.1 hypothetical protein [Bacteroidota bacterium]MDP4234873.1 hypothetical protein [Bacteroidota bacterium]
MQRSEKNIIIFSGLIGFLACIIPVWLRPEHYPSDDAYFYLQVASNIVAGYGSTFNRIAMTNGFHPLWQICCTGIFVLTGGDKSAALLLVCIFQQLLFIGILYYVLRLNEFLRLRFWYLAIPVLVFYFLCTGLYASEAHLHGLLLVMLTYYVIREVIGRASSPRDWLLIGVLTGLLFLARLDSIFFSVPLILAAAWKSRHDRKAVINIGLAAIAACCLGLPYVLYNYFSFGHFVPISGAIKSTFPYISANFGAISGIGEIATLAGICGLFAGLFSEKGSGRRWVFLALSCGTLLLTLYLYLFTDGNTRWAWYYVVGITLAALLVAYLFDLGSRLLFRRRERVRIAAAVTIFLTLVAFTGMRSWSKYASGNSQGLNPFNFHVYTDKKWQIEIALWLRSHMPAHTNIFMFDWPGMIGYYSDMNILSSDGLINDYEYNDRLRRDGINSYLKQNHVFYWLGHVQEHPDESATFSNRAGSDSTQIVTIYAPLYRTSAGSFLLTKDHLVADFRTVIPNPLMPDLALWMIDPK